MIVPISFESYFRHLHLICLSCSTEKPSSTFIDTTKTARGELFYRKIEFYPPTENQAGPGLEPESKPITGNLNDKPSSTKKNPNKHLHNFGAIKSIETLAIKRENERKGITEQKNDSIAAKTTNINSETAKTEEVKTQPAPDPYRYRYILWILIVVIIAGTAAYFLLRKTKIFISVVSFLKKIF